jgi:phosphoribosyl 1,2-cyclic phosphate phosphodiesterase
MKVTVLGCGPSQGVPVVGNRWGDCDPENPRNRRSRPSILVEDNGVGILVDTSPDIRSQLLDNDIRRVDAVLYTHLHYDHVGGIGELRTLSYLANRRIDLYGTSDVMEGLRQRWDYLFEADKSDDSRLYKPVAKTNDIDYGAPFDVLGVEVTAFRQDHGICDTAGFRFGKFAYTTDAAVLEDEAFEALQGVEVWIVDCLRDDPHPTHAHFERTLEWIEHVGPRRAIFTHMNFQADYETIRAKCPEGVEPGYDGMTLEID